MRQRKDDKPSWLARKIAAWLSRLGQQSAECPPEPQAEYPLYLTCPHCGEPEIEVWDCNAPVRCHNCEALFPCSQAEEASSALPLPRGSAKESRSSKI